MRAELTTVCNSPQNNLIYKTNTYTFVNAGLKASLLNNKLKLTLTIRDIFDDATPYKIGYSGEMKQIYHVNFDSRQFQFGLSYNFGNNKVRVRQKEFSNQEEQDRS